MRQPIRRYIAIVASIFAVSSIAHAQNKLSPDTVRAMQENAAYRQQVAEQQKKIEAALGVESGGDISEDPIFQKYCAAGQSDFWLNQYLRNAHRYKGSKVVYTTLWAPHWKREPDDITYCSIIVLPYVDDQSYDLALEACSLHRVGTPQLWGSAQMGWIYSGCPDLPDAKAQAIAQAKARNLHFRDFAEMNQ